MRDEEATAGALGGLPDDDDDELDMRHLSIQFMDAWHNKKKYVWKKCSRPQ